MVHTKDMTTTENIADRLVTLVQGLLSSTDTRPYSHRVGLAGTTSGTYLTGATDAEAQECADKANASRPAGCVALRPFVVTAL